MVDLNIPLADQVSEVQKYMFSYTRRRYERMNDKMFQWK